MATTGCRRSKSYNEPGQNNNFWMRHQSAVSELPSKSRFSQALLTKVFGWAREVNPEQPIFSSAWKSQQWTDSNNAFIGWENKDSIDHYVFEHSDIIGYHDYQNPEKFSAVAAGLTNQFGDRPVLNTEWMARSVPNTLLTNLPVLNRHGIGAVNWGLVNGKIQTIYPWRQLANGVHSGTRPVVSRSAQCRRHPPRRCRGYAHAAVDRHNQHPQNRHP